MKNSVAAVKIGCIITNQKQQQQQTSVMSTIWTTKGLTVNHGVHKRFSLRPDSLLRLCRYINHLLTYLLIIMNN